MLSGLSTSTSLLEHLQCADRDSRMQAWRRFVMLYTPLIMHWALQKGLQHADASDVTQQLMIRLVKRIHTYQKSEGYQFRGWLYTVFHHLYVDYVRDQTRHIGISQQDAFLESRAPTDDWEQKEYNRWLVSRGLKLIRMDFSEQTWHVFESLMFQHKSVAEVARQFNISTGAVYLARHRVLARLRETIAEFLDG